MVVSQRRKKMKSQEEFVVGKYGALRQRGQPEALSPQWLTASFPCPQESHVSAA